MHLSHMKRRVRRSEPLFAIGSWLMSYMELQVLQKVQEEHDGKFHKDVMSWDKSKQIEHCAFHLAKIAGLFSTYCEKVHHGELYEIDKLVSDRIPDLLIFALKFANIFDQDLEEIYLKRIRSVEASRKP